MRVIDDLQRPDGLTLSLDQRILYVADNAAKTILSYTVKPDGSVTDGKLFAQLDLDAPGGGDGMSIDQRGTRYPQPGPHLDFGIPRANRSRKSPCRRTRRTALSAARTCKRCTSPPGQDCTGSG